MRRLPGGFRPAAGLSILCAGPFLVSWPFLVFWIRSDLAFVLDDWLLPVLLLALVAGCLGLVPLRVRTSSKFLMLVFYAPVMAAILAVWAYSWCSLCDF